MAEAGSGLELEFLQKFTDQTLTSIGAAWLLRMITALSSADDDPWYMALQAAFRKHELKVARSPVRFLTLCPGEASDLPRWDGLPIPA